MTTTADFMWPKWTVKGELACELSEHQDAIVNAQHHLDDMIRYVRQALIDNDMWTGCDSCHIFFDEQDEPTTLRLQITCSNPEHAFRMSVPEAVFLRCNWCGAAGCTSETCEKREW